MRFLSALSDLMVPVLIFYVVGLGLLMKQDVFGDFLNGAKDGMRTVIGIVPTLIGLMAAVGVLRSSGFLEEFGKLLGTVLEPAGIPSALVPLGVVRLFSNSAAVGLLLDLYKEAGCDSFAGRAASIMMSCTETVFYTMAVYFGAVQIKNTVHIGGRLVLFSCRNGGQYCPGKGSVRIFLIIPVKCVDISIQLE
ncbi:MAG: nucleoside recognition domain-containing protein [Blautia sp.]